MELGLVWAQPLAPGLLAYAAGLRKSMTGNPLVIVGYPRSGTTLLRAVLGSHSSVSLVNESELISGLLRFGLNAEPQDVDREALLEQICENGGCRRHIELLGPGVVGGFLRDHSPLTFRAAYEALLPRDETSVWGEKSLDAISYVPQLLRHYPNALVIHLVRDPRAVLLSLLRKRRRDLTGEIPANRSAIRFFTWGARCWRLRTAAVAQAASSAADQRVVEIRFEDLVRDPEGVTGSICDRLGIEFEPAMLDATRRSADQVLQSSGAYAHRNLTKKIAPDRADGGKELPAWAAWLVSRVSRLDRYGYTPSRSPGGRQALRVLGESTLWSAHPEFRGRLARESARGHEPAIVSLGSDSANLGSIVGGGRTLDESR